MRVIAGSVKGFKLKAPATNLVRPAADKVKGAVFNILGDISGARVLDLFAGSGSMGIEALSRGATHCVFVEAEKKTATFIENNLKHCKLEKQSTVFVQKVNKAIPWFEKKGKQFDLIFVDPPYDKNFLNPTLQFLASSSLLTPHTLIICEHSPRELPKAIAVEGGDDTQAPIIERLEIKDQRKYGQTFISFMKLK